MFDSKPFFRETAATASFALREYFRPLAVVLHIVKSSLTSAKGAEVADVDWVGLDEAQALLRERLAKGRHLEKLLLTQTIIASVATLVGLVTMLLQPFDVDLPILLAVLLPICAFGVWVTVRLIQRREEIVELKTLHWVMKSVDRETAERVARQLASGKAKRQHPSKKAKEPS
jgi:hypothetical protein